MTLLWLKLLLSAATVFFLAEISKRCSPFLGGLLLGLPLGSGLSVYFISYEQGVEFMTEGIPWGIAGLIPSLLFGLTYLWAGRRIQAKRRWMAPALAAAAGTAVYLAAGGLLRLIPFHLWGAVLFFLFFYFVNLILIRRWHFPQKGSQPKGNANGFRKLWFRAAVVGGVLLAVTGIASLAGNRWAGVLSAFPSTMMSLLLLLHYEEGDAMFPSIIRGFAHSVITLLVFYLSCSFLLPVLGLNLGFVAVYAICLVFLFLTQVFRGKRTKEKLLAK